MRWIRSVSVASSRALSVMMPCFFWYCVLHFTRSVAIFQRFSGILSNDISQGGNTSSRSLPTTPT